MAELDAAIVIAARNEADNLGRLLEDCAALSPAPKEVIVVDAGSTDGTPELVSARQAELASLRLVHAPDAPPGRARNAGIEQASAAVIATVDGGSRVDCGWLAALLRTLNGAAQQRVVVGVAVADAHSEFERALGWFTLRAFKPPDAPSPIGPAFRPAGRNGYCFARSAWRAVGGYDAELGWGEDKLFLDRLRGAGYEVVVAHDAVVRWRPRGSLAELYAQYRNYGRGDVLAGIDRQNVLVPLALYAAGALLAARGARGHRGSALALRAGAAAYLGLFVAAAAPELRSWRALSWVPAIRVTADIAKLHGLVDAVRQKLVAR